MSINFVSSSSYSDLVDEALDVLRVCVEEAVRRVLRGREGEEVDGRDAGLLARRHEHHHRLPLAVLHHSVEGRPAHGEEPGCVVRDVHAVDVELEGDRPHVGVEVEGGVGAAAEPTVQSS